MILKLIRKEILIRKKFLLSVVFYGLIAILALFWEGKINRSSLYFQYYRVHLFLSQLAQRLKVKKYWGYFPACP